MTRRLRWTVVGLVVLALLGAVANVLLRNDMALTEVWRADTGTELRREPGGEDLREYLDLVGADPSGKRVDFVARRPSPLDRLFNWSGQDGEMQLHRLDETETVVEAGGERWRRYQVRAKGITPEEVEDDLHK